MHRYVYYTELWTSIFIHLSDILTFERKVPFLHKTQFSEKLWDFFRKLKSIDKYLSFRTNIRKKKTFTRTIISNDAHQVVEFFNRRYSAINRRVKHTATHRFARDNTCRPWRPLKAGAARRARPREPRESEKREEEITVVALTRSTPSATARSLLDLSSRPAEK